MNFKHNKPLVALALVFFMVAPMLLATSQVRADYGDAVSGTISAVQYGTGGTTNINTVTMGPSPNPVTTPNQQLKIDVYISGAANVYAWHVDVAWDPSILKLVKVQEGNFLKDDGATGFVGGSTSLIDNVNGLIQGGMGAGYMDPIVSSLSSGVLATLTFNITGYGVTTPIISAGTLRSSTPDPSHDLTTNGFTLTSVMPVAAINVFKEGTTDSTVEWPSTTNPINGTFNVTLSINGGSNIWAWNCNVSWNPEVLMCINVTEGDYLKASGSTWFAPGYIDNDHGTIQSGIGCAYTEYQASPASSGVLAILVFKIINYQSSDITLPGATILTPDYPHEPLPITTANGSYVWNPAQATDPQAVFTVPPTVDTNMPLSLDGSASVGGVDMIPPYQDLPITQWTWDITFPDSTTQHIANQTTFNIASVGAVPGNLIVTLTVTAPDTDSISAPTYNATNSVTKTVMVTTPR
jgi:hypothetical protein